MKKLTALIGFLIVAACGSDPIDQGTVIDKRIDPENTILVSVCTSFGKYGCAAWVMVPQVDDEDFLIRLEDDNGRQGWRDVTPDSYYAIEIGEEVQF